MDRLLLETGDRLLLETGDSLLLDQIVSPLSWITDENLGIVFENDNLLIPLEATSAIRYDLIITGRGELDESIENIGTKTIIINDESIRFGFNSASQLDSKILVENGSVDVGIIPGTSFSITDFLGTDTVNLEIIIDSSSLTFPINGILAIGPSTNVATVSFTGESSLSAVVSTINSITNNAVYGIEALENSGVLRLKKSNAFGGTNILIETGSISSGDLGLTDGITFLGLDQIVSNINSQVNINTDNILASVQGTIGANFLRIEDTVTSLLIEDNGSEIIETLLIPESSPVSRVDVVSTINDLSINTGVSANLTGTNRIQLIGPKVFLSVGDGASSDILEILKLNNIGNEFIDSPITEWLFLNENTGVLQGIIPDVLITSLISFAVRATALDSSTLDRTFNLTIQPIEAENQISWNPGSIGTFTEGDISESNIPVNNFAAIEASADFFILKSTTFNFLTRNINPWNFSRNSTGSFIDINGILRFAEVDEQRFDYNGSSPGILQGLLVEAEATNLFPRSNTFNNGWSIINSSVSENFATAPTQNIEAWKLIPDGTANEHGITDSINLSSGTEYALSIFGKSEENSLLWLRIGTGGSDSWVVFNLSTGVVANTNNGATTSSISGLIQSVTDNWYKNEVRFTSSVSGSIDIGIYITTNSTTPTTTFSGNNSDGLLIYGAQIEQGAFATSYFPTTGIVSQRAADVPILDLFNLNYIIDITGPGGTTQNNVSVTDNEYVLLARIGERHVQQVRVNRYQQEEVIDNNNLTIDSEGNISGTWPFHTPPPTTRTYTFEVVVSFRDSLLLGPDNWSFDIVDTFTNTFIDVSIFTYFTEEERSQWSSILNGLITSTDSLYRPQDENFGFQKIPIIGLMNGLQDNTLENYASAVQGQFDGFQVIMGGLNVIQTDNFDVLYYEVFDNNSTVENYPNPLGVEPFTITPKSLAILRTKLQNNIGFENGEILPSYLSTWSPIILAAFVLPGLGSDIVQNFNNTIDFQAFKGKTLKIDKLVLERADFTSWGTSLTEQYTLGITSLTNTTTDEKYGPAPDPV